MSKIKKTWKAIKRIWVEPKGKRPVGRPKGSGTGKGKVHFTTPESIRCRQLLESGNFSDTQISKECGLSRERVRQIRNFLNIKKVSSVCSPSINEDTLTKMFELAPSHTIHQASEKLNISCRTLSKYAIKHGVLFVKRQWKIHPDVFKDKFELNEGIISSTAKAVGISNITAIRYCRKLGLKSKYWNHGSLNTDSKYDCIRDEMIKEIVNGESVEDACNKRGVSPGGFRAHLMYKGVNITDLKEGKSINESYQR
jgi:hypothetical protein